MYIYIHMYIYIFGMHFYLCVCINIYMVYTSMSIYIYRNMNLISARPMTTSLAIYETSSNYLFNHMPWGSEKHVGCQYF